MKKLVKKYHCPECDEDLTNSNSEKITDITEETLDGVPLNGSYMIGVVKCKKCGTKSISYEWWSNTEGYDKIKKIKDEKSKRIKN